MGDDLNREIRKLRLSIDGLSKTIQIAFGGKTINHRRRKLGMEVVSSVSFSESLMPTKKEEGKDPWAEKQFEYVPPWVRKDGLVNVFYDGDWYKGRITAMPEDNDRAIEVETWEPIPETGRRYLSIPVYMVERSDKDWSELMVALKGENER